MNETILYMKDNKGTMREWGISADGDMITMRFGQMGGSMQYRTEQVNEGKQSRDIEEQVQSRIDSRISKQMDRGYIYSFDEAFLRPHALNALGLRKPMLAQKIDNVKNIDYTDAIAQPKFDGNRCMIYCENGINRAYSRNGKPIEAIDHILADLPILGNTVLDGELYCHGYTLQSIVSWIKRKQEDTLKLKYHLYDIVAPTIPYKRRSMMIRGLPIGQSISPVYGDPIASESELYSRFREYRQDGYEGAILRWGNSGYEDGKRSKSLVKVKEWESEEFTVASVVPSSDGWGILICHLPNFETFRVSAPGSINEKIKILENKYQYIGKQVTIEFANYTKDGKPFHPVAINFRDEIQ
jgi:ATP-dependent DNA ligase